MATQSRRRFLRLRLSRLQANELPDERTQQNFLKQSQWCRLSEMHKNLNANCFKLKTTGHIQLKAEEWESKPMKTGQMLIRRPM